jgi:hypothetical protein
MPPHVQGSSSLCSPELRVFMLQPRNLCIILLTHALITSHLLLNLRTNTHTTAAHTGLIFQCLGKRPLGKSTRVARARNIWVVPECCDKTITSGGHTLI